jgi:hypothetical protein
MVNFDCQSTVTLMTASQTDTVQFIMKSTVRTYVRRLAEKSGDESSLHSVMSIEQHIHTKAEGELKMII